MVIAVLGLGKMGSRIARKLSLEHEVHVWNRTPKLALEFKIQNSKVKILPEISEIHYLKKPRVIWLMLPAGEPTVEMLYEIKKYLEEGDVIIDGGNSHYKDTDQRYQEFTNIGIEYLGIGVSGGIFGEKEGYPLMVGGSQKGFGKIKSVLETLSKPNGGYEYFGIGGAGHFVKMVHNGIEYGMMQSIGEGFGVLQKSSYKFNLSKIARLWTRGTIVSGFLMNRATDALGKSPALNNIVGEIDASGEAGWTVEAAEEEGVDVEIIERSLEFRLRSKKEDKVRDSFSAKLIAALRREFGGHDVKKKA